MMVSVCSAVAWWLESWIHNREILPSNCLAAVLNIGQVHSVTIALVHLAMYVCVYMSIL